MKTIQEWFDKSVTDFKDDLDGEAIHKFSKLNMIIPNDLIQGIRDAFELNVTVKIIYNGFTRSDNVKCSRVHIIREKE